MSKKDEKIIISKQLARDLIWWLEHASAPCMTIGEVHEHWHLFKDSQMTLARDSMKDELERSIKKIAKHEHKVCLTVEEAKKLLGFFDVVALCDYPFRLSDEEEILWETLDKRIKQAEGKE